MWKIWDLTLKGMGIEEKMGIWDSAKWFISISWKIWDLSWRFDLRFARHCSVVAERAYSADMHCIVYILYCIINLSPALRCRVTVLSKPFTPIVPLHQAAKLVAALLRVAGVTAGLVESNGSLPPGLWLTSPAVWLLRTGISSGTLRSVWATFFILLMCHCSFTFPFYNCHFIFYCIVLFCVII